MGNKVKSPKYLNLYEIQLMIDYILNNTPRPSFVQLNPKPLNIIVMLYTGLETEIQKKIQTNIDSRFSIIHFNEKISLEQLYNRFTYNSYKLKLNYNYNLLLQNYSNLINYQSIEHMFSYSEYIKSKTLFDTTQFKMYCRPNKITKYNLIAMDCEMYETTKGDELGRITILNYNGNILYDKYITTNNKILDYRTKYSGLTQELISNGISYNEAKQNILQIIGTNTTVVGHGLDNDLKVLKLYITNIIDTSYLYINTDGYKVGLNVLCKKYLNYTIHQGYHDSIEDALCCLKLLAQKTEYIYNFLYSHIEINHSENIKRVTLNNIIDANLYSGYKIILYTENNNKYISFIHKI